MKLLWKSTHVHYCCLLCARRFYVTALNAFSMKKVKPNGMAFPFISPLL